MEEIALEMEVARGMLKRSQSRGTVGAAGQDSTMLKRSQSRGTIVTTHQDSSNSIHTYSEEEKEGLVDYVNALLRRQQRPINTKSAEIFEAVKDGVLLCRIVNAIQPGLIDDSRINLKDNLSIFEKGENLMLALQSSHDAFNISFLNIGVQDVLEGKPILVLALLWQLVTVDLRTRVRFHSRDIDYLLHDEADGADVDESEGLPEEYKIVLRWVNHHLTLAGMEKRVHNFSNDFKDSVALIVLLNRLAPRTCSLEGLKEPLISTRATLLLQSAELIGCNKFLSPNDITQGNARSIFAFLAYLFTRFNKPAELRKAEEKIEEQAIELADIHQEIESIVDNISNAQDKIEESSQRLAIQRDDSNKEKEIIQQRIVVLEEQRKAQATLYNEKIVALQKAVEANGALPSVAELTQAIKIEHAEQEAIHKAREQTLASMEILRDNVSTSIAERMHEEVLLSHVDKEITVMEEKHATQAKTLTNRIDALGLTSLKQRLDDAIAQNAESAQNNEKLTGTRDDLTVKVRSEGAARAKASAARLRVEAQLAKAKTEITNTSSSKATTAAASTRLEKKLVAIKTEIGKVKKDTIFVEHQTTQAKDETESVKEEAKSIVREKTELLFIKEDLESEVEEIEDEVKELQREAEDEAMRLKNKKDFELTMARKENNEEVEKLEIAKEKAGSKLINAQADLASKQVQQIIAGHVVNMYDGEVRRLKQQLTGVQEDINAVKRENNILSTKQAHTQKVVDETKTQSLEDDKLLKALQKESREALDQKESKNFRRENLEEDVRHKEAEAHLATMDADIMAASVAAVLREERTLSQLHEVKEREVAAEKEERKRESLVEGKKNVHTSRIAKEKEEFERRIQELTGKSTESKTKAKNEELAAIKSDVQRLKNERELLANNANTASKKLQEASKEKAEMNNHTNKLSQDQSQAASMLSERKREEKAASRVQTANTKK